MAAGSEGVEAIEEGEDAEGEITQADLEAAAEPTEEEV